MEDKYVEWQMTSWEDAVALANKLPENWIFRGHSCAEWKLETALERCHTVPGRVESLAKRDAESTMLETFKRQAHNLLPRIPGAMENLDWLAMLQHHGGATRLLDVTRSFYVGVFFAVEQAVSDSMLWAFDRRYLGTALLDAAKKGDFRRLPDVAKAIKTHSHSIELPNILARLLMNHTISSDEVFSWVVVSEPWHLDERAAVQQGLFLCPLGHEHSFETQICRTLGLTGGRLPRKRPRTMKDIEALLPRRLPALMRIRIPYQLKNKVVHDLRQMNITAASLFPGIDGFARGLNYYASGYRAIDDHR